MAKEGNRKRKAVAEVGWMPFWWGNKFNKRLASKRERQNEKKIVDQLCEVNEEFVASLSDMENAINKVKQIELENRE